MDVLRARDLAWLADEHGGTRISVFLPTHRSRLKDLLRHGCHALRIADLSTDEFGAALWPACQLLDLTSL
jgi:hypothetical protein